MNKSRIRLRVFTVVMTSAVLFSGAAGCTKPSGNGTTITFYAGIDAHTAAAYQSLERAYNEGQGKTDGVTVKYIPQASGYDKDLSTVFYGNPPDVLLLSDQYFKDYTKEGYLYCLDEFAADETLNSYGTDVEPFSIDDLSDVIVNRFRIDWEKRTAGNSTDKLYAIPNGSNPTFLYYNEDAFAYAGINVISVAEDELSAYNKTGGTSYMPHGYCEYDISSPPATGLTESVNLNGDRVIKVFNNRIAMSWNELDVLAKYLTRSYFSDSQTEYGFLSEWWFAHGFSVGGDCMNWDNEENQYVFTLGNEDTDYLVTKSVEINGTVYEAGELLRYNDRKYVAANVSAVEEYIGDGTLYAFPSQYDAFAEFCALSQTKGARVDSKGKVGYGISPTPTRIGSYSNSQFFTAKNVAIVAEGYSVMNTIAAATNGRISWNVAPLVQYREYENGDMTADGVFKIIGCSYDGELYSGELKTVNGVAATGKRSGADLNTGYVIPSKSAHPQEAYKFIRWAAGVEGQKILGEGNALIPNQSAYAFSEEYLTDDARLCTNTVIAVEAAQYQDIGDWSYVEDGQWVNHWSNILNTDVRNGDMTLNAFFNNETVTAYANANLKKYLIRLAGK